MARMSAAAGSGDREPGERWTTLVLVLPDAPLVEGGPPIPVRRPRYPIVLLVVPVLALDRDTPGLADGAPLAVRLAVEERTLGRRRSRSP